MLLEQEPPDDKPVARGCHTFGRIKTLKTQLLLADPPQGYFKVYAFPPGKGKNLSRYGIIVSKMEAIDRQEVEVFYFRCLCNGVCSARVTKRKVAKGSLDKLETSGPWKHLNSHSIYSTSGQVRTRNKHTFNTHAALAKESQLRASDPQRYFELRMTGIFVIDKLAPFAWFGPGNPGVRGLFGDLHSYYRDVMPPDVAAKVLRQAPGFEVKQYHEQDIQVRGWAGWVRLVGLDVCLMCAPMAPISPVHSTQITHTHTHSTS